MAKPPFATQAEFRQEKDRLTSEILSLAAGLEESTATLSRQAPLGIDAWRRKAYRDLRTLLRLYRDVREALLRI